MGRGEKITKYKRLTLGAVFDKLLSVFARVDRAGIQFSVADVDLRRRLMDDARWGNYR